MADIILHHYPMSPYAEKARVALGIKKASWRSVIIPVIMPKPDLMPLTGGYRKTPVMQIGADVYCDTQLILRELERRIPEPSFYSGGNRGLADSIAWWAERSLFNIAVGVTFAKTGDQLPQAFRDDRAKFSGREFNAERTRAAEPRLLADYRAQLQWLEETLSGGRAFLLGDRPSTADAALYHMVWFVRRPRPELFAPFPNVSAWADRIKAIGYGTPIETDSKDALAVAKAATPAAFKPASDPNGPALGSRVTVTADDSGRDPVTGELMSLAPDEIVIRRTDPAVGDLHQHFPRVGFVLAAAA
jgi:glutathione S-transferase